MFKNIIINKIPYEKLCELGFIYSEYLRKWIFSVALNSITEFTFILNDSFSEYTLSIIDCDMGISLNIENDYKLKNKVNKFMKKFKEFGLINY